MTADEAAQETEILTAAGYHAYPSRTDLQAAPGAWTVVITGRRPGPPPPGGRALEPDEITLLTQPSDPKWRAPRFLCARCGGVIQNGEPIVEWTANLPDWRPGQMTEAAHLHCPDV